MPMPLSGQISLGDARTELGYASTQQITLNDTDVRTLFARASGENQLLYGYGKVFRKSLSVSIPSNQVNYTVCFSNLTGYVAGKTDVTVTIAAGVYVYSTSTAVAGLTIACTTSGDTCILNNNGYIMGMGGNGGDGPTANKQGKPGGTALKLGCPTIVNNSSYIAGGGGGGGAQGAGGGSGAGGGGGAGGGNGGYGNFWTPYAAGGAGGAVGQPGSAGAVTNNPTSGPSGQRFDAGGGGGGRILPGSGGDYGVNYGQRQPVPAYRSGQGGGAGGGGAGTVTSYDSSAYGGAGGAASNPGNGPRFLFGGAGGGGWGAPGGNGHPTSGSSGGVGGKAIDRSGYTLTYGSVGTIYGGVS